MNVFYVKFARNTAAGHPVWILLETDLPSIEAVTNRLNEGKLVHGFELMTRPCRENRDNREVMDTREVSFRLEEVKEISVPRWGLYRYAD